MARNDPRQGRGFSLLELVIVVVVLGIIAAIAIPRLSRGSAGARDSALLGNLAALRAAIDMFAAEHPGILPTKDNIAAQLTQYSDAAGNAQPAKDAAHVYGPYLRHIPPLPVGARKGATGIADLDAAGIGWIYDQTTGAIRTNTTIEADESGKLYRDY